MHKEIEFYIPCNISMRDILQQEGKRQRYIDCQIDKYHWFLHSLYQRSIINKKYFPGDFIPMNSKYMESVFGIRYMRDILKILSKHNIIESNGSYSKGEESIGYRLTPAFQVRHVQILEDNNSSTFIKKLKNMESDTILFMDDVTKYTHFQLQELSINREAAESWVENWFSYNIMLQPPYLLQKLKSQNKKRKKAENKAKKKGLNVEYPELTFHQMLCCMRDAYMYQIKAVDEKLWIPNRDNKGRRIHSFISTMKREFRQFLYLKNSPDTQLVSLDCSNSQPYTLVKIILDYFKGGELTADAEHYIQLVTTGKLYSFMCKELGIVDPKEVADFKTEMFANVFYSANEKGFFTKEAEIFRSFFSTVYQIIMCEKKYQYELLAIEMQRVETEAVIDGVLSYLMNKYQLNVFFTSIHDSIVCPAEYAEEVRELMIRFYNNVVGMPPHIKNPERLNIVEKTTAKVA